MPRRPGAIGPGYLPKGGARVALDMAAKAERERSGAAPASASASDPVVPGEARGRVPYPASAAVAWAVLVGSTAGVVSLLVQCLHVIGGH